MENRSSQPAGLFGGRTPVNPTGIAVTERLDPSLVGLLIVDQDCHVLLSSGLAIHHDWGTCHQLKGLVESTLLGKTVTALIRSMRVYTGLVEHMGQICIGLLIVDASHEMEAMRRATASDKRAETLKRIGKALTMHQTLVPLSVAAVHAISSAIETSAVLLWIQTTEDGPLELAASVGASRAGITTLSAIDPKNGVTCAAELVAMRRRPLILNDLNENPLTQALEAQFCYLTPGGITVWPLSIGNRLVGVLEIIGRVEDSMFVENADLYATIAEHLSLALNSAYMYEGMEKLAAFDPLTGIANHRTMQEFLHRRIIEAERSNGSLGAIMLDVDHFRKFNEDEGHDVGDKVLKLVAGVLKSCVRPYDLAARYGGEEFTVIMPGASHDATMAVAERIRDGIEKLQFTTSSGATRSITASVGCALYPESADDSVTLLKAADLALYNVKRTTRNRVEFYNGTLKSDSLKNEPRFLEMAREAIPNQFLERGEAFLQSSHESLEGLSAALNLSVVQVSILSAATLLLPYWLASETGLGSHPGIEPVLACISDFHEEFDGSGPRGLGGQEIPLLTRVLSVLYAVHSEGSGGLTRKPGRFDPAIVEAFTDVQLAA